jgi:hypothetical protein
VSGSDKEHHEAMINKQNPCQFLAMHIFFKGDVAETSSGMKKTLYTFL